MGDGREAAQRGGAEIAFDCCEAWAGSAVMTGSHPALAVADRRQWMVEANPIIGGQIVSKFAR